MYEYEFEEKPVIFIVVQKRKNFLLQCNREIHDDKWRAELIEFLHNKRNSDGRLKA